MATDYMPATELVARSKYVRALRAELPASAFEPATSRIALVPLHLLVVTVAVIALALHWLPWFLAPVLSLVIGVSFACLTFIAHEAVHGGIVRGRAARQVIGWIGFLPFTVSPRLWAAWHDRVHHANANVDTDPDMYPLLSDYHASRRIRFFVDAFAIGGRRLRGALSLVLGFTVQSAHQLIAARRRAFLDAAGFRRAIAETIAGVAIWTLVAVLVGFPAFVFAFVVPLVVANVIVMSFILTNHGLSPRVEINDPLASGLSVTRSVVDRAAHVDVRVSRRAPSVSRDELATCAGRPRAAAPPVAGALQVDAARRGVARAASDRARVQGCRHAGRPATRRRVFDPHATSARLAATSALPAKPRRARVRIRLLRVARQHEVPP